MKRKIPFLSRFTKSGFIFTAVAYLARGFIATLFCTLRVRIRGVKKLQETLKDPECPPIIIALWHAELLLMPSVLEKYIAKNKFTILVSNSRDGEIPTAIARSYRQVNVIRVSHNNRIKALMQMVEILTDKHILVLTPDGPRGPIYEVKPGIIFAAKKSGALICPLKWHAEKCIRLKSWDTFCIPLPFSKVTVTFDEPFTCPEEEAIEIAQKRLKTALTRLT